MDEEELTEKLFDQMASTYKQISVNQREFGYTKAPDFTHKQWLY